MSKASELIEFIPCEECNLRNNQTLCDQLVIQSDMVIDDDCTGCGHAPEDES